MYKRTQAGADEMVARKAPLSIPTRRLLGLIVGEPTHEELQQRIRGGDLDRMLNELIQRGFVEGDEPLPVLATATQPATIRPELSAPAPVSEPLPSQRLLSTKRMAVRFLLDHVGPTGESLALRVERASDGAQLEHELIEVKRVLLEMRGRTIADKFYATVIAPSFGSGT